MKRFRLSMLCLALAVCTAVGFAQTDSGSNPAPAQQNDGQMQRGHRGRGMRGNGSNYLQSLNLSQDQKDKIRPILQDQRDQMRQLRQDQSLSRQQRMQKMQQIHENTSSRIRALLTPDQQKIFDAHEQEMKQRMQQRRQQWRNRQSQNGDNQ